MDRIEKWEKRAEKAKEFGMVGAAYVVAAGKTVNENAIQPTLGQMKEEAKAVKENYQQDFQVYKGVANKISQAIKRTVVKHVIQDKNPEIANDPWRKVASRAWAIGKQNVKKGIKNKFANVSTQLADSFSSWKTTFNKHLAESKGLEKVEEKNNGREM
jgi:hypothetical protein